MSRGLELELTSPFEDPFPPGGNFGQLDSISFVVPEPATTGLLGLGAAAFMLRRLYRRHRNREVDG